MYAKTGGKNGRHNNVLTDSSNLNIIAISYLAVQIFEHRDQFRAIPNTQRHQVLRFNHLPPSALLCHGALKHGLELTPFGLKISLDDRQLLKVIKGNSEKVSQVVKLIAGRRRMPASIRQGFTRLPDNPDVCPEFTFQLSQHDCVVI